jgi:hypothetical protein
MTSRRRACPPALLAGFLIVGLGLQGCVATTVAGATLGVAGAAVRTAAKVTTVAVKTTGRVAGAAVHVTANAAGHASKEPPSSQ